ncbi:hypothetical protein SNEBB_004445 [Seison nebaliae]|nr:hypothetical protein SNEBB_004445 [Seison nebaliae]
MIIVEKSVIIRDIAEHGPQRNLFKSEKFSKELDMKNRSKESYEYKMGNDTFLKDVNVEKNSTDRRVIGNVVEENIKDHKKKITLINETSPDVRTKMGNNNNFNPYNDDNLMNIAFEKAQIQKPKKL